MDSSGEESKEYNYQDESGDDGGSNSMGSGEDEEEYSYSDGEDGGGPSLSIPPPLLLPYGRV